MTNTAGGTLVPGTNGVGTLTLGNRLTLNAGSTNTFAVNGSTSASTGIALGSAVTYGGVLNVGTSGTFTAGQTFTLFSGAGATNPSKFAGIVGSPGGNLFFTFTNGVLSVVSTGPTLASVTPNPVPGSSYAVTLGLSGSGFGSGSPTVWLTNLTAATSTSYVPATITGDTNLTVSFVPGTAATFWNATVVNGSPSATIPFRVTMPVAASLSTNAWLPGGTGKLVLSGTGGTPGYGYEVVAATNLSPPVGWVPLATNVFDGGGNFSYTNTLDSGTPQLFLRLAQ